MAKNVNPRFAKPENDKLSDLSGEMHRFAADMRRDDADARDSIRSPYADALDGFADRVSKIEAAARQAQSALDGLMGDSDLPNDESQEMKAMQALSAVLDDCSACGGLGYDQNPLNDPGPCPVCS